MTLADPHVAEGRAAIRHRLEAFDLIPVDAAVLERAAEPFPTLLGTLDAVHLASAVLVRAVLKDLVSLPTTASSRWRRKRWVSGCSARPEN